MTRTIFSFRFASLHYYGFLPWCFGIQQVWTGAVAIDVGAFRLYVGRGW